MVLHGECTGVIEKSREGYYVIIKGFSGNWDRTHDFDTRISEGHNLTWILEVFRPKNRTYTEKISYSILLEIQPFVCDQ